MSRFLTSLVGLIFFTQTVFSEEIRSPLQNDLARAYGFYTSQKLSIERIRREYPTLAANASRAQLEFDLVFRPAYENIETELQKMLGSRWLTVKNQLDQQIQANVGASPLQTGQVEDFINEVNLRAKGQLESPVLQTLLSQHPDFRSNPAREFASGFTNTYRSANHPKAKGVDFQIQYPKSWSAKDGVRPNVIQLITSENGRGLETITLMVKDLGVAADNTVTQAELEEAFSIQNMKDMVPPGSTFISAQPITLDGQKGAMLLFDTSGQRVDLNMTMRSVQFLTVYKNKVIFVYCSIGSTSADTAALRKRFEKFEPLFKLVANSFVIQSRY